MQQFSVDLGDKKGFARDAENTQGFKPSESLSKEDDVVDAISPGLKPERDGLSLYV